MKNWEITQNPKILLDQDFDRYKVTVEGLRLDDDYRQIPLIEIVEVVVLDCDTSYDNFTKRLEKLTQHDGFVSMAGRLRFCIKNQRIAEIELRKRYVNKLRKYNMEQIIGVHGVPDRLRLDSLYWFIDEEVYALILCYSEKQLYFFLDPKTTKIDEIRIGDFDESKFDEYSPQRKRWSIP